MALKLLCNLRRKTFFFLDQLQGGVIKKAYSNLELFDNLDSNSSELSESRQSALKKLLTHAVNTTNFYSGFNREDLKNFPVITKETIRSEQDNFLSRVYDKDKLIVMFTSGSTGTPFSCYQDKTKKKHVTAELIYYSEKAGYQLGKNFIYLRGFAKFNQRGRLKQWFHNQTLILISKLDDVNIEDIIAKINIGSESVILGYASTYDSFKSYFQRKGNSLVAKKKIKGIISNGEMLSDDTRLTIEEAFNCRCYSRYSNQENGVIGQDSQVNNAFILNEAHYIVEILRIDSNEPAEENEVGRVVITDLYNYAMPMIRYDTGDVGSLKNLEHKGITKKVITNFGGRKIDRIFDCRGNTLSASVIVISFEKFSEIEQFQFIQLGTTKYLIRINVPDNFSNEKELVDALKSFLGQEAKIEVEYVREIPILASGKRKMILNEMK